MAVDILQSKTKEEDKLAFHNDWQGASLAAPDSKIGVDELVSKENLSGLDFIKVDVDENHIDKKYLAYLFNSIIGRYYYKYSAKGKNQTMVKISSDELNGFFLPIPPLDIQLRIVTEIKTELDTQEIIKTKIEKERNKIDEIIENAIKNS